MSTLTVDEAPAAQDRRGRGLVGRVLRMEIRHSAFLWVIPLIAILFFYDPYRTASGYPDLWSIRSTVVLNKFWPDIVIFAAGFAAWSGTREGRRNVTDLLATTARPAWARQLCSLAGTAFWVLAAFLAGTAVLYVTTSQAATWGSAPVWPVVVGVAGLLAVCTVAFTLGALFPGRFTAPVVAVGIMIVTLVAFRQAVTDNGGSTGAIGVLSPDGGVPGNDWGLFYPVSIGVPVVQVMFMLGVVLAAVGVLGLSPRTGGVGWRGALSAVAAGGARVRTIAVSVLAAGVALAVAGFVLAETANVSDPASTLQIPAIDSASSTNPIPYTPVCTGSFRVCVHPAFRSYLPQVTSAIGPVIAQLSGLPGVPARAAEVSQSALPATLIQGNGDGQLANGVYEFSLSNAVALTPDNAFLKTSLQQDLVRSAFVGFQPVTMPDGTQFMGYGTLAQQAVMDGILKALGTPPFQVPESMNGTPPPGLSSPAQQAQVMAAAAKFAALPAAQRHAWLVANFAALKSGHITLAQLP
jgi:hypothetical protein